jgi:hypothetical protein
MKENCPLIGDERLDDEIDREINRIARMSAADVYAEMHRLGLKPLEKVPRKLRRLMRIRHSETTQKANARRNSEKSHFQPAWYQNVALIHLSCFVLMLAGVCIFNSEPVPIGSESSPASNSLSVNKLQATLDAAIIGLKTVVIKKTQRSLLRRAVPMAGGPADSGSAPTDANMNIAKDSALSNYEGGGELGAPSATDGASGGSVLTGSGAEVENVGRWAPLPTIDSINLHNESGVTLDRPDTSQEVHRFRSKLYPEESSFHREP